MPMTRSAEDASCSSAVSQQSAGQVIAELDDKKREALHKTWLKVNQDFGSIFSTLLPETSAKLEPPEGQSYLAGGPSGASSEHSWAVVHVC